MPRLKRPVLERLPRYYRLIQDHLALGGDGTVSSAWIAEQVGMDDTQVRKDLAAVGVRGSPRVGFDGAAVVEAIHAVLGFDREYPAVIVGAGRLGGALAAYPGFEEYGLRITALFDIDPARVGRTVGGAAVRHADGLPPFVRERGVRLGILTVPPAAAQPMADVLAEAGVEAIWNFAPTLIHVPPPVTVRHEHLSVGLAELAYVLSGHADEANGG